MNIERTNSISLEFELNNRNKFRAHTCHHVAVVHFPPDVELREEDRTLHQGCPRLTEIFINRY